MRFQPADEGEYSGGGDTSGPVINTLLTLLVGLAINSSFSGKRAGKDDHNRSPYADINIADIPTCADFLTEVGLTTESA